MSPHSKQNRELYRVLLVRPEFAYMWINFKPLSCLSTYTLTYVVGAVHAWSYLWISFIILKKMRYFVEDIMEKLKYQGAKVVMRYSFHNIIVEIMAVNSPAQPEDKGCSKACFNYYMIISVANDSSIIMITKKDFCIRQSGGNECIQK